MVLLLIWPAAQAPGAEATPAEPEAAAATPEAQRYVALCAERLRLQAENAVLSEEQKFVTAQLGRDRSAQQLITDFVAADAPTRDAMLRLLQNGSQGVLDGVDHSLAGTRRQVEQLTQSWVAVRSALARDEGWLLEVQSSRQMAGRLASLLSVDKRWFWLFGVLAVGTLLVAVLHDRRHELRRRFHGGRGRSLALSAFLTATVVVLLALTLITFLMGDRVYRWFLGHAGPPQQAAETARGGDDLEAIQKEVAALGNAAKKLQQQVKQAWSDWQGHLDRAVTVPAGPVAQAERFRGQVVALAVELRVLESLPRAVAVDTAQLERLRGDLADNAQAATRFHRWKQLIRGGLGLTLLVVAFGGGLIHWRGARRRRQIVAETCPLCLGRSSLKLEREPSGTTGLQFVKCKNVISRQPHEQCDYRFAASYREMAKLNFPTLGVPQAGKTHWLATIYWLLNRGHYPRQVEFQKIKSQTTDDYETIVEEILNSRLGTAATQRQRIPQPLVFNFRDRDWLGRSSLLVNIFDYSGEVTSDMGVDDYRRRRALEADGYLFFLDPTYPAEPQAKALKSFHEDLRVVKGLKSGRTLRTPVALCVSKIDLLVNHRYSLPDGEDAIQWFYKELARIDPSGEAMELGVVRARSQLLSRLREIFWPGWEIEREVEELFGGRHLFFPLTPVGLDGRGETDLNLRTISPFGMLEPLVWLLEMNGYSILK